MIRRSRLLRALLIALAVLGVAGFGAFSTFVFNPLEGGLGVDVAGLVDRDVDFFLARAELSRAFEGFPHLAVEKELEEHPTWKVWAASPEKERLWAELGVEQAVLELEELAARMPLGLSPLQIFGGRDLALAGHFQGAEIARAEWAVYGTLNWTGKIALELLRYPGLLGLEEQGLAATTEEDWVRLSGGELSRELYLARIKDVGIVATSSAPIAAAKERHEAQFADSMLLRAEYGDHVLVDSRSPRRDEVEIWIDLRDMFENLKLSGAWPDPKSKAFLPALCGRYFQLNLLNYVVGTLALHNGLSLDLRGQISSELMTPLQERTYYRSSADQDEIRTQVAMLAPEDSALFVYLKADIGDFLSQVVEALDPNVRELLTDAFKQTGKYQNLEQIVDLLDSCLKSRLALIVRPNDYPEDPDGPPHDGTAVPSIALILWLREEKRADLENFRNSIGYNPQIFGLRGKAEGEGGYYRHTEGGYETREFWNQLIPGTGAIATVNAGEHCIITNSHPMLQRIMFTYTQGAPKFPRLSERGDFEGLLSSSIPQANLVLWANPRALGKTLRQMARRWAEDSIFIDWAAERAQAERTVVQSSFPDQAAALARGALPPEIKELVDQQVEPILEERRRTILETQVSAVQATYERRIEYAESITSALIMLGLDTKRFDLSARIIAPFLQR